MHTPKNNAKTHFSYIHSIQFKHRLRTYCRVVSLLLYHHRSIILIFKWELTELSKPYYFEWSHRAILFYLINLRISLGIFPYLYSFLLFTLFSLTFFTFYNCPPILIYFALFLVLITFLINFFHFFPFFQVIDNSYSKKWNKNSCWGFCCDLKKERLYSL